jgi:ribosome-binding factor A
MPRDFSRTRRVGELLQRELARLIGNELSDPRVRLVTVTAVEVSKDLRHAKVFVTQLGSDEQQTAAIRSLGHAAGYLRRELSHVLDLKVVPQLHFEYDTSVERGVALSRLIEASLSREKDRNDH